MERIAYIGIDVHKDTNTAHLFTRTEDSIIDYEMGTIVAGTDSMIKAFKKILKEFDLTGYQIQAGYEAGPTGYGLCKALQKAEPFKVWLAQVGADRLDEILDHEKAIMRGADFYRAKSYTEGWINQRLQTIEIRKELTDEWKARGIEKENLRDNMTNIELVLNMLAEVTATTISKQEKPEGFEENKKVAVHGEKVANSARENYKKETGQKAISSLNAEGKPALEIGNNREEK